LSEKTKLLSAEQVDTVAQFAQALYTFDKYGYWSPALSNSLMQNLNNNAKMPTPEGVRKALNDYRNNANELQSYVEYTRFFDMLFARTVEAYVNSLSFDLQVTCTNAYTKADFESKDYIEDKRRVNDFLNKFKYKSEFRKVVNQMMLHEAYFVSFRKTKWGNQGMKYALQILPQERCLLTGYWEKGLLFDFDMSYFLQAGTDLDLYDPSMKVAYQRVFNEQGNIDYRPSVPLDQRNGVFAMYTQLSPNDGYFCFKRDASNFNMTPFLAPYLKNALTNDEVQQLQFNKDMAEAYAILAGEIATFDNAKSGTQQDQTIFKPTSLANFMKIAKNGLSSTVKLAALPTENLKWYQFQDYNEDMYTTQMASSAAVGVGASRLIYATDRMSNAEVEASLNELYQTMRPVYAQFNNFLEFYVNKITKKYHFSFNFDGSNYSFERTARLDRLMKIADKGMVLNPSAFASALGIEPQLFEASLLESKNSGWTDNLQLLLNANTMSKDNLTGRPQIEGSVNESTERSRNQ